MFIMTLTRKGRRATAAEATTEQFLKFDHKSVAEGEEVEEDDATSDSEKRKRDIADWIGGPCKTPSSNKDKESEGEEEDVSATQASTEENYSINEYETRS